MKPTEQDPFIPYLHLDSWRFSGRDEINYWRVERGDLVKASTFSEWQVFTQALIYFFSPHG